MAEAAVAWVALIAVSVLWGQALLAGGHLHVVAPPFAGAYRLRPAAAVPGTLFAAAAVALLPRLAAALRWRALLATCWLLAAGWAVVLNVWDGHSGLAYPIGRPQESHSVLPAVGDHPLAWLRGFTAHLGEYPLHVRGHPPLMVLVLWVWEHAGLSGGRWAAALVIGVGASSVVAVAVTVRAVSREADARRVLPFLVLAPFALTVATSADAFFAGVAAWSAAAFALGARRMAPGWLAAGGLLAGALPYLSYGLLAFGTVPLAAAVLAWHVHRSRVTASAIAAGLVGLAALPVLMTVGGFWWPAGAAATHDAWSAGLGADRPYLYSFVADLAVLGVLVGPATAAGAVGRMPRPLAVLAGSALVAVLVLDLSGVTRLEVERIWLPFAPWLMVACASLRRPTRGWLVANVLCALAFQVLVFDAW